ncbi:hypothetical protein [Paenibacillus agricola]|uniref:Uncharacterized protein n=1 Tax=Paenibacillus agricola TaxID=2716264 RepID=A0ABX0JD80_9BACL|nr:hypothetical protein [Paenibacillus agricola]NHN33211.1 hypothetical protein [Paenibacillus agricola]
MAVIREGSKHNRDYEVIDSKVGEGIDFLIHAANRGFVNNPTDQMTTLLTSQQKLDLTDGHDVNWGGYLGYGKVVDIMRLCTLEEIEERVCLLKRDNMFYCMKFEHISLIANKYVEKLKSSGRQGNLVL